jgi:hypothetical protein
MKAGDFEAKNKYECLLNEVIHEINKQPIERNTEYLLDTQKLFEGNGIGLVEHRKWRDTEMLASMLAILHKQFQSLNPLKQLKNQIDQDTSMLKDESDKFQMLYKYEQEIDQEGKTIKENAEGSKILYPNFNRKDLELLAADDYLKRSFAQSPSNSETRSYENEQITHKSWRENTNPRLTYRQMIEDLSREPVFSKNTVDTAIRRCIKDIIKNDLKLPKEISRNGLMDDYQLVGLGPIVAPSTYPSPSACIYQKISQSTKI